MPRYRFQWANFDEELLSKLCEALQLPAGEPAEALRARFGARPKADFVRAAWSALLDHWLASDDDSSAIIAEQLRGAELGDPSIGNDLAYLRSCRNTKSLREAVLSVFLAAGEVTQDTPPAEREQKRPEAPTMTPDPTDEDRAPDFADYVASLVAEALGVHAVRPDADGDIPVRRGSSLSFVRAVDAQPPFVKVFTSSSVR